MLTRIAIINLKGNIQRGVALSMSGQFLGQVGGFLLGGMAMMVGAPGLFVLQSVLLGFAAMTTSKLSPAPPMVIDRPRTAQLSDKIGSVSCRTRIGHDV